jgi:hypothetical protein
MQTAVARFVFFYPHLSSDQSLAVEKSLRRWLHADQSLGIDISQCQLVCQALEDNSLHE